MAKTLASIKNDIRRVQGFQDGMKEFEREKERNNLMNSS